MLVSSRLHCFSDSPRCETDHCATTTLRHCVGADESEDSSASCERIERDYNIGLRIGMLFVVLASSSLGTEQDSKLSPPETLTC
jgi:hypothetical protein